MPENLRLLPSIECQGEAPFPAFTSGLQAAAQPAGDLMDRIEQIMLKRRRQVVFRLIMMGLMVVFFSRYLSFPRMLGWAVLYTGLQAWEYITLAKPMANERGVSWRCLNALGTLGLNSIIFGAPALIWGIHSGFPGLMCGTYLLSGAMLNTVFTTRDCKPAFIASASPFVIYIIAGAFLASESPFDLGRVLTITIAGMMMSLCALTLWIDASRTLRSERAALFALGEREVQLEMALQRAEEASNAKSAFLANMSHELRTPLNGVLGMVSVLARTSLDTSQTKMVDVIHTSAKSLQVLLSDVLDLAKIEAAQINLQSEAVIPAQVARNVAALFSAASAQKGLSFVLDTDADSELAVTGDSIRIGQVITNLCSNAVKFTEKGGVWLRVRTVTDGAQRRVTFTVEDTGIGMSPEARGRIFQRFAQADDSITRRFGGTGLGLAICEQLCLRMNGVIEVTSVEGEGSIFTTTFDLPAAEAPLAADTPALPETGPAKDKPASIRILLVEDHPVNRQVVQLILEGVADIDIAVNGAEGVEAVKSAPYDAILMDMQMPVMDGISATQAIRALERETGRAHTPIIMLTANAMAEHIKTSIQAGADAHLAKPITAEALLSALDTALEPIEKDGDLMACA